MKLFILLHADDQVGTVLEAVITGTAVVCVPPRDSTPQLLSWDCFLLGPQAGFYSYWFCYLSTGMAVILI